MLKFKFKKFGLIEVQHWRWPDEPERLISSKRSLWRATFGPRGERRLPKKVDRSTFATLRRAVEMLTRTGFEGVFSTVTVTKTSLTSLTFCSKKSFLSKWIDFRNRQNKTKQNRRHCFQSLFKSKFFKCLFRHLNHTNPVLNQGKWSLKYLNSLGCAPMWSISPIFTFLSILKSDVRLRDLSLLRSRNQPTWW